MECFLQSNTQYLIDMWIDIMFCVHPFCVVCVYRWSSQIGQDLAHCKETSVGGALAVEWERPAVIYGVTSQPDDVSQSELEWGLCIWL